MKFKVGDKIQVCPNRLEGFKVEYQKKVKNRIAIVERVLEDGGLMKTRYTVKWQKRAGRGKEFFQVLRNDFGEYELVREKEEA